MNVLEAVGGGVNRGLAYIGGLTIQFWGGLCASPSALPIVGKRGRWRAALQEMRVVGVDALPMVGIMSVCTGFILAMQAGAELRRFRCPAIRHGHGSDRVHARTGAVVDRFRRKRPIRIGVFGRNRNDGGDQ